jgi:hypothetical protein
VIQRHFFFRLGNPSSSSDVPERSHSASSLSKPTAPKKQAYDSNKPKPLQPLGGKKKRSSKRQKELVAIQEHCLRLQEEGQAGEEIDAFIFLANLSQSDVKEVRDYLLQYKPAAAENSGENSGGNSYSRSSSSSVKSVVSSSDTSRSNSSTDISMLGSGAVWETQKPKGQRKQKAENKRIRADSEGSTKKKVGENNGKFKSGAQERDFKTGGRSQTNANDFNSLTKPDSKSKKVNTKQTTRDGNFNKVEEYKEKGNQDKTGSKEEANRSVESESSIVMQGQNLVVQGQSSMEVQRSSVPGQISVWEDPMPQRGERPTRQHRRSEAESSDSAINLDTLNAEMAETSSSEKDKTDATGSVDTSVASVESGIAMAEERALSASASSSDTGRGGDRYDDDTDNAEVNHDGTESLNENTLQGQLAQSDITSEVEFYLEDSAEVKEKQRLREENLRRQKSSVGEKETTAKPVGKDGYFDSNETFDNSKAASISSPNSGIHLINKTEKDLSAPKNKSSEEEDSALMRESHEIEIPPLRSESEGFCVTDITNPYGGTSEKEPSNESRGFLPVDASECSDSKRQSGGESVIVEEEEEIFLDTFDSAHSFTESKSPSAQDDDKDVSAETAGRKSNEGLTVNEMRNVNTAADKIGSDAHVVESLAEKTKLENLSTTAENTAENFVKINDSDSNIDVKAAEIEQEVTFDHKEQRRTENSVLLVEYSSSSEDDGDQLKDEETFATALDDTPSPATHGSRDQTENAMQQERQSSLPLPAQQLFVVVQDYSTTTTTTSDSSGPSSPVKKVRRKKHKVAPAPFLDHSVRTQLAADCWKNYTPDSPQKSLTPDRELSVTPERGSPSPSRSLTPDRQRQISETGVDFEASVDAENTKNVAEESGSFILAGFTTAGTQTEGGDFGTASKNVDSEGFDYKIIVANNHYTPHKGESVDVFRSVSHKLRLDKSVMVDISEEPSVDWLYSCFPGVAVGQLNEVLEVCNGDVELAVELMFDWGITTPITPTDRRQLKKEMANKRSSLEADAIRSPLTPEKIVHPDFIVSPSKLLDLCMKTVNRCSPDIQQKLISSSKQRLERLERSESEKIKSIDFSEILEEEDEESSLGLSEIVSLDDFTSEESPDKELEREVSPLSTEQTPSMTKQTVTKLPSSLKPLTPKPLRMLPNFRRLQEPSTAAAETAIKPDMERAVPAISKQIFEPVERVGAASEILTLPLPPDLLSSLQQMFGKLSLPSKFCKSLSLFISRCRLRLFS